MDNQKTDATIPETDLDELLNAAAPPPASDALNARILKDFDREAKEAGGLRRFFETLSYQLTARRFVPAGAIAGLGALGFITGLTSAASGGFYPPQTEALYYADAAFDAAFAPGEEAGLWDAD